MRCAQEDCIYVPSCRLARDKSASVRRGRIRMLSDGPHMNLKKWYTTARCWRPGGCDLNDGVPKNLSIFCKIGTVCSAYDGEPNTVSPSLNRFRGWRTAKQDQFHQFYHVARSRTLYQKGVGMIQQHQSKTKTRRNETLGM